MLAVEQTGAYDRFGLGPVSQNHSFILEAVFETVICCKFWFGSLTMADFRSLRVASWSWCCLCDAWLLAVLTVPCLDLSVRHHQAAIPTERVAHLGALSPGYPLALFRVLLVQALTLHFFLSLLLPVAVSPIVSPM